MGYSHSTVHDLPQLKGATSRITSPGAEMKQTPAIKPHHTMRGHTERVGGVAHLPDRRRTITCSYDGSIRLWDMERGIQIGDEWQDDSNKTPVLSIALPPNGETVVSGSSNGIVRLWDAETRKVIARWKGHTSCVWSVCWSADGERVMSGSWDANTGKLRSTIKHEDAVRSLAWISDQKKLISGSWDGSIRIFDTATWQGIVVLKGHTDLVYSESLSLFQNDRLLASASSDKTVRLWNLDTNLPVSPPLLHQERVISATISADGKRLVTGCCDKNTYI
ncbi:WD40 repeat-like protein [Rhizopogon vinicolor AM-OR11-026]|uniref:WD40 repeat-like protein n=1 Tax=Rhizopogon vinicolor AM-OR11-026 TaxID=1314800 RepID=A0A1B7MRK2_9AGAM|nr:WD40 repeat-like protein [Rhizopogon vinicolor AM-OR11-026]